MFNNIYSTALELLSLADFPQDVLNAWNMMEGNNKGKFLIISLDKYDKRIYPNSLKKIIDSPDSHFIPYFESDKLYFMDNDLLEEMLKNKGSKVEFPIDYSIMLDTNYSSYIDKFVNSKDLSSLDNNIFSTIDILIREEFQYDYLFYIIENYKNTFYNSGLGKRLPTTELKAAYWSNLVSLELFKNIDKKEYCNNGRIKYNISKQEACLNVDDIFSRLFNTSIGKKGMETFLDMHKNLVLFLIGVLRIRFESKKSYHYKIEELFEYMNSTIGPYFEREMIIAHKYFQNPVNVQLINKVNRGMDKNKLLKCIENFAWDFASPRIMEFFLKTRGEGKYFIPLFLSNDKNLRDLLKMFKVKGAIFNDNETNLIPITNKEFLHYFRINEPNLDLSKFFSDEGKNRRKEIYLSNKKDNFSCIETEFLKLATVMKCK